MDIARASNGMNKALVWREKKCSVYSRKREQNNVSEKQVEKELGGRLSVKV